MKIDIKEIQIPLGLDLVSKHNVLTEHVFGIYSYEEIWEECTRRHNIEKSQGMHLIKLENIFIPEDLPFVEKVKILRNATNGSFSLSEIREEIQRREGK